jgi:hypothetical protein
MTRLALATICLMGTVSAGAQTSSDVARAREAMLERGRPGPEHAILERLAGRWQREVTYTMGGGKTMKATGSATNRVILGGRFLQSDQTTTVPASEAMPATTLDTLSIYGFDRRTREFTIVEFDTGGTYFVTAKGAATPGSPIVMSGESLDDHGGKPETRRYDMVLRVIDADTYVTQVVFKFEGQPPLTLLEATHRRMR